MDAPGPIAIAAATAADLPHILALLGRARLPPDGLAEHLASALVARDGDRIIGSVALEVHGQVGLLRSVAVDEAVRGRGLGARLTAAALELARARRLRTIYLLTETAAEFFPRFGFRPVTRADVDPAALQSVEFTTACPDSATVMALDLTA
jgi:amino-acid N-acetyltransferase